MARKIGELFYELRTSTESLTRDLKEGERQFGKFAEFVKANPIAAVSGLAAAFVGVAYAASQAAGEIDQELRQTNALLGSSHEGAVALRTDMEGLAAAAGESQADVARLFRTIADNGPGSAQNIKAIADAAIALSQVLGGDFSANAQGLDLVTDIFQIDPSRAREIAAALFEISRGRVPLADLLDVLSKIGPDVAALGLDFETTSSVITRFLDQGYSIKRVASTIKELANNGAEGRAELVRLAGAGLDATVAMHRLADEQDKAQHSAEALSKRVKNELNSVWLDFGNKTLPVVTTSLAFLVGWLDGSGDAMARMANGALRAKAAIDAMNGSAVRAPSKPLGPGESLVNGTFSWGAPSNQAADVGKRLAEIQSATRKLESLTVSQLRANDRDLAALEKVAANDSQLEKIKTLRQQIGEALPAALQRATRESTSFAKSADQFDDAARAAQRYADGLGAIDDPLRTVADRQQQVAAELDQLIAKMRPLEQAAARQVKATILDQLAEGAERVRAANVEELTTNLAGLLANLSGDSIAELMVQYDAWIQQLEKVAAAGDASTDEKARAAARTARETIPMVQAERDALIALEKQRRKLAEASKILNTFDQQTNANFKDAAVTIADRNKALSDLEEQERVLSESIARGLPTRKAQADAEKLLLEVRQKLKALEGGSTGPDPKGLADMAAGLGAGLADAAQSGLVLVQVLGQGNSKLASMLAGVGSLGKGIQGIGELASKAGGFKALFSTGAGAASAVGSLTAIAGGAVAIAQALDLFGTKARERARQMREAAVAFNAALDDFLITTRTSLEQSIQANIAKANELSKKAAEATGVKLSGGYAITSSKDLQGKIDELSAAGRDSGIPVGVRESALKFRDELVKLQAVLLANEETLRQQNAAEITRMTDSLQVRRLAAAGMTEEANAERVRLDLQETERQLREKYGAAIEEYIIELREVTEAELAAAAATRARTKALSKFDTDAAILGTSAADRLSGVIGVIGGLSSEFAGMFDDLNLETREGLAAAKERLRDLYRSITEDGEISAADEVIIDFIRRIFGGIDEVLSTFKPELNPLEEAADQLDAFGARVEVFGLNAQQRLTGLAEIFQNASEAVKDMLIGVDLSTEEGRGAFKAKLLDAINGILQDGVVTEAEAPLLAIFRQLLGGVIDVADEATQEAEDALREAEAARASTRRRAGDRVAVFDLGGLDAFTATLEGYGSAFSSLFDTFDLSTLNGVNDAKALLRQLFTEIAGLSDAEILSQFGMTRDELMAAILDVDGGFDQLAGSLGDVASQALEAAQAVMDFVDSISQDFLRAQGNGLEADINDARTTRDNRIRQAQQMGLGQGILDQIEAIFQADVAAIRERYSAAANTAVDRASPSPAATASNQITRTVGNITEITAQSLVSILRQIESNTRSMAAAFGGGLPAPPSFGRGGSFGGGPTIVIHFAGPVVHAPAGVSPADLGTAIGKAQMKVITEQLGKLTRTDVRALGKFVV